MNKKRIFALAFAVLMLLALAACGTKNNDKMGDMSGNGSAMTDEPKNAEEALTLHKELLEQENAILSENTELWEKVFMKADKGMAMIEDGKNYGDFLLDTIEAAKEQFADNEYELSLIHICFKRWLGLPSSAFPIISQVSSFCWESCWDDLSAVFCVPSVGFRNCCIKSRRRSSPQRSSSR